MGWWKADPVETPQAPPPPSSTTPSKIPFNHPPVAGSLQNADACPVDDKTRQIWLDAARKQKQQQSQQQQQQQQQQPKPSQPSQNTPSTTAQVKSQPSTSLSQLTQDPSVSQECSSDRIDQGPQRPLHIPIGKVTRTLSEEREISTIPRAHGQLPAQTPSNNEVETGTSKTGNWIYPSESQFFNAVMRKSTTTTSPEALVQSVSSIIPIHNAVNERAWHLIKQWEGNSSKECGGPKLLSFQGLGAGALSPKAKWNTMIKGATEPFDRHDWIVERCDGSQVEYLIDFYQGKEREDADPRRRAQELNFFLDVRPKLNTFEGVKMRAEKLMGWR